jgi:predicted AAA+ superfamily ATPase
VLSGRNRVREDVLDESLDERVAPSLGGVVVGIEHRIYTDPREFFRRTLVTESMVEVLENIARVVTEGRGSKLLVLSAFFGGGKTHTLIALYHAVRNPETLKLASTETSEARRRLEEIAERLRGAEVVVIDGSMSGLSPSPISPLNAGTYTVQSLWGYLAHSLGRYEDFRRFDQALIPPQVDDIVKLLSGRRVVIIVDEIAQYLQTLYSSRDETARNYSKNVVTFFDRLASTVVALSNAVLVISLPVRGDVKREGEIEVEEVYRSEIVRMLLKVIGRVEAKPVEPVKPPDIPMLLRVRLFDEVDSARAREVDELLRQEYDRNRQVFGEVSAELISNIRVTYPFHPKYVEVLLDVLDKHRGLQKTRDLLKISRKVVRYVVSDRENAHDLIMPWHIDVEKDDIRNLLLSSGYEALRLPVEEDIVRRCGEYSRPWLARAVSKALFIRTFVYSNTIVPKPEFFPTSEELAVLVYEPGVFRVKDSQPKDIAEAVDWISSNLLYVLRDEKTGRLWFTYISSPVKYVEAAAQRVVPSKAYERILEATKRLLTEPPESIIERKRGGRREEVKVFDVELSRVSRECRPVDVDARKYLVYVCLDVDPTRRSEVLEEVMYRTTSGGRRRYANTVYVVYPERGELLEPAISFAKRLVACDEVRSSGVLDELLRGLKLAQQDAEVLREFYREKLERYCDRVTWNFYSSLLGTFTRLAYPATQDSNMVSKEARLSPTTAIIYTVEQALKAEKPEKVKLELDFDTLEFYLRSVGVEFREPKRVGDTVDYFYSNPRLPAVPEVAVRGAIADGVRNLRVGLKCGDRVYFKYITVCGDERCLETSRATGEVLQASTVADVCEVLPVAEALRRQMEGLESKEVIEGNVKKVEEYCLVYEGRLVNVKDVLREFDKYPVEALVDAPLVKVVRRVIVDVEPKDHTLCVEPEQEVQHKVVVSRSGPFVGAVRVKVDAGSVEPTTVSIDEKFTTASLVWTLRAPREPGTYSYVLSLVAEDGRVLATARIGVIVRRREEVGVVEGLPQEGTLLRTLSIAVEGRDLKPVKVLRDRLGKSVVVARMSLDMSITVSEQRRSQVAISMSNVDLEDVLTIATGILGRFSLGEVRMRLELSLVPADRKSFGMPKLSREDIEDLSRCKVRYEPAEG